MKPVTGRRCGWPDEGRCKKPDSSHLPPAGERRVWGYHDQQCPVPNPRPGPHPAGYPVCALIADHAGGCDYHQAGTEPVP